MTAAAETRPSLGVIVGLPFAALLALICLGIIAWLVFLFATEQDIVFLGFAAAVFGVLLVVVALTGWFMWPWKAEYHQWTEETGTVTQVDSRLIGQNKSTTERFVVTLDGNRQRSCDDTRCAQVKRGDILTLTCKRAWQYTGTHGYDCNFVNVERDAS